MDRGEKPRRNGAANYAGRRRAMNKDAAIALQAIYAYFREHGGQWPAFAYFERWLNRYRKQDAILVLKQIPCDLLKPLAFAGGRPDPAGRLVLTAAGVDRCLGSDDDTQNLVAAVQCLLRHYTNYDLPDYPAAGEVPISPKQLADELNLPLLSDPNSIKRLIALLEGEGLVVKNDNS